MDVAEKKERATEVHALRTSSVVSSAEKGRTGLRGGNRPSTSARLLDSNADWAEETTRTARGVREGWQEILNRDGVKLDHHHPSVRSFARSLPGARPFLAPCTANGRAVGRSPCVFNAAPSSTTIFPDPFVYGSGEIATSSYIQALVGAGWT